MSGWLNDEMTEAIAFSAKTGNSAVGPVFGAAVNVLAYVEPGNKRVINAQGEEILCNLFAVCPSTASISVGDKAVYDGETYEVIDVQTFRPRGEAHHIEAYMRSRSL